MQKLCRLHDVYRWLGPKKGEGIKIAVMDMCKPFMISTKAYAPQVAVLFDKFHVIQHLGEALDKVRHSESGRWFICREHKKFVL